MLVSGRVYDMFWLLICWVMHLSPTFQYPCCLRLLNPQMLRLQGDLLASHIDGSNMHSTIEKATKRTHRKNSISFTRFTNPNAPCMVYLYLHLAYCKFMEFMAGYLFQSHGVFREITDESKLDQNGLVKVGVWRNLSDHHGDLCHIPSGKLTLLAGISPFSLGNTSSKCPCFIAILVYRSAYSVGYLL